MANEHDVLAAWLKICRGDTTPTVGLVALTGNANPAVTWQDPADVDLPRIVFQLPVSRPSGGAPYRRSQTWPAEVWVPRGSLKLAHDIMDRLEAITTYTAFAAESLDVQVQAGGRAPEPPGAVNGYRLVADYRLTVTV